MNTADTDLFLIRHGQPAMQITSQLINGRSNHVPLTAQGRAQSELVGPWLHATYGAPDIVIASPAVRTQETGRLALCAAHLDRHIIIEDDLQEMSQGEWTGLNRAEVYTPAVLERLHAEQLDFKAPGGESPHEVMNRGRRVAETVPSGTVWLFGHGLAIRCLVGDILGWTHAELHESRHAMYNTSVTHIRRVAGVLRVVSFALAEHVPEDMRT